MFNSKHIASAIVASTLVFGAVTAFTNLDKTESLSNIINDENNENVVVYFYRSGYNKQETYMNKKSKCPCNWKKKTRTKKVPALDSMQKTFANADKKYEDITFVKVDARTHPQAAQYKVGNSTYMLLFKNGQEVARFVGNMHTDTLEDAITTKLA